MHCLGVVVNFTRSTAREGLARLCTAAQQYGLRLLGEASVAQSPFIEACPIDQMVARGAEAVIALGGDGTLLATAHAFAATPIPLIGFNFGNFGYLTAVNDGGLEGALLALKEDRFTIESRTTLTGTLIRDGQIIYTWPDALNDLVVSRVGEHAVELDLLLEDRHVAHYLCDGLIFATPTGSTAYSLSAGGPVVLAPTPAMVLSILAPHALSARPLVMPDTIRAVIRITEQETEVKACADGANEQRLIAGDEIVIQNSYRPVRLVVPEGLDPYLQFARKLGWGSSFMR